jgi:hypothetical protein
MVWINRLRSATSPSRVAQPHRQLLPDLFLVFKRPAAPAKHGGKK